MQTGMLFHSLLEPKSGVYFEQLTHRIEGELRLDVFQRAWQEVIDAHSLLKVSLLWKINQNPVQLVHKIAGIPWETHDLSNLSVVEYKNEFDRLLNIHRNRSFDMSEAPLIRMLLIKVNNSSFDFVLNYHHILLDAWSLYLVIKEVFLVYESILKDQYYDISEKNSLKSYIKYMNGLEYESAKDFWKQYLTGYSKPIHLSDYQRDDDRHGDANIFLDKTEFDSIRDFSLRNGFTVNTLLQTAWALLVAKFSEQSDIVYGMIITNRPAEIQHVGQTVGVFVNTLPARITLINDENLLDLLLRLQNIQAIARKNEHLPIAEIQAVSQIENGTPLFGTLLIFENFQADLKITSEDASLKFNCTRYDGWTNYPLSLTINNIHDLSDLLSDSFSFDDREEKGLQIRFKFDCRYYDNEQIGYISRMFKDFILSIPSSSGISAAEFLNLSDLRNSSEVREKLFIKNPTIGSVSKKLLKLKDLESHEVEMLDAIRLIFAEVLELPQQKVKPDSDFFALGGTSFLSLRVISGLEERFIKVFSLGDFFLASTPYGVLDNLLNSMIRPIPITEA